MPGTIANAYVQILPSAEGMKSNLTKALGGDAEDVGKSLSNKIGGGLKTGLGVAAKAAAAGIAAAGTAAVALGSQAMESYANYEQLIGGVETLFGESADKVINDASQAFKTAGMSANDYMETSIQSAAALINSLGGDQAKAADLMGMSITDMSDNVNKMGTSMEAVQNAYRGFSRGNFTMLDNLALGFAGTKEGMQELLNAAEQISGVKYDINSYSDIVQAIHEVQTQMGITGTTAREAMTTISGSVNATKAAWQNLLTGIADENADFEALVNNFIDSAMIAAENILPRVQTIMDGLGRLITEASQRILPIIIDMIVQNLPQIIASGVQIVISLITGIVQALPQLVASLPQIFSAILGAFRENWPALRDAGVELLRMVGEGIASAVSWLWGKVTDIGRSVVDQIYSGIASKWGELVGWFNSLWDGLFGHRSVNVNVGGGGSVGHYATGLDYVPYDDFPAILHKGEAVLTASEASDWRRSGFRTEFSAAAPQGSDLADVLGRMYQLLDDLRQNGIPAYTYLDGREVSDTVTRYQRRAVRAGGAA